MGDYLKAPDGDGYWWWRANGDDEPQLARVTGLCLGKPRAYFCMGGIMTAPFWGYWERAIVRPSGDREGSLLGDLIKVGKEIGLINKATISVDPLGKQDRAFDICQKMIDELVEKYK